MDLRRSDVEGGLVTFASIPRIHLFIHSFVRSVVACSGTSDSPSLSFSSEQLSDDRELLWLGLAWPLQLVLSGGSSWDILFSP